MSVGLTLGKYEPLHQGHLDLFDFAKSKVDKLYILLCTNDEAEVIPGYIRLQWLNKLYKDRQDIIVVHTDKKLPYTSESDRYISKVWSDHIRELFGKELTHIISSEKYGDYVAEYLGIEHIVYDTSRITTPISGTECRRDPFKNWNFLPDIVKPYFIKKVCICGTESTGKTILTEKLSIYFDTNYVQEWGRIVVPQTEICTQRMLFDTSLAHAKDIEKKISKSNKILFSDTDLYTTKSYHKYLFGEEMSCEKWIEDLNKFDLYLFLENDSPYIQDGTRLDKKRRDDLREHHYNYFLSNNLNVVTINGSDWDERYHKAINIIKEKLKL